MNRRLIFLIGSGIFLISFILIVLKNIIINGEAFVVNGDIFDKFKFYTTTPGFIPAFLVILIIYQNIHNYNYYVIESITILSSSILYGWLISIVVTRTIFKKKHHQSDGVS